MEVITESYSAAEPEHSGLKTIMGMSDDQVQPYAKKKKIPILMEIQFHRRIAEAYSRGEMVVDAMPEWKQ